MIRIAYNGKKGHPAFIGHKVWQVCRIKDGQVRVFGLPGYQRSWITVAQ